MPGENYMSWSPTAANNDTADTAINWREGMARAAVNDNSPPKQRTGSVPPAS